MKSSLCCWVLIGITILNVADGATAPGSGRVNDQRYVSPAVQAEIVKLQSEDVRLRSDAMIKLRYLGTRGQASAAAPFLIRMLGSKDEFPRVVLASSSLSSITESCAEECTFGGEAAETLARIGDKSDELLELLGSGSWRIQANAIRALGGLADRRAVTELLKIVQQTVNHWEVRGNAALALGLIGDRSASTTLIGALKDAHAPVRASAAAALGQLKALDALEPLRTALHDPDPKVRRYAVGSLGQIKADQAVEAVIETLQKDPDRVVREVAASALRDTNDRRAILPLILALKDEYANVQVNAANALGQLRCRGAFDSLLNLLGNDNEAVRAAAAAALGKLGDQRACAGLLVMVRAERSEIPFVRGLEALSELGQPKARSALERYRRQGPPSKESWNQIKAELLVD